MKKRILSFLMAFVMSAAFLLPAAPVSAATATPFKVTPDKTEVVPGDTITYTVNAGAFEDCFGLSVEPVIPDGLTYVKGSIAKTQALNDTAPDSVDLNPNTGFINILYPLTGYDNTAPLDLCTFQCTVDADATGTLAVTILVDEGNFITINAESIPSDLTNLGSAVTVKAAPKPATGITLNKTSFSINAAKEETLVATVTPADSTDPVVWTTSDPTIATVTDGKVKALKAGTVTITATAGTKSASCTVQVKHPLRTYVRTESTCETQGWESYHECEVCGKLFAFGTTNEISEVPYLPLADHTYGELIAEVPATCTDTGVAAHYECSVCGKLFDAEKNEVTAEELVIPALGHTPGEWQYDETDHWKECTRVGCGVIIESTKGAHTFEWVIDKAATEDATGLKHEECTVCGAKRSEGTIINKLDHTHTMTHHAEVPATCTDAGVKEYWTCSKCTDKIFGDAAGNTELTEAELVIPALGHTYGELIAEVPATCTDTGVAAHYECSVCGKLFDEEKNEVTAEELVIPALGHTYGELIAEVPATCTDTGVAAHYECSVCGKLFDEEMNEVTAEELVIPALGHTPGEWQFDETNHWKECEVCGTELDKAPHAYGEWKVNPENPAEEIRVCECGSVETREIPEKPESKPDEKPESKPDEKPESKPDEKPESKPDEKPESKPDEKPESKPESKPEPEKKPDAPNTGDNSAAALAATLAVVSAGAVVVLYRKKHEA